MYLHMLHHVFDQWMVKLPANRQPQPVPRIFVKEEVDVTTLLKHQSVHSVLGASK